MHIAYGTQARRATRLARGGGGLRRALPPPPLPPSPPWKCHTQRPQRSGLKTRYLERALIGGGILILIVPRPEHTRTGAAAWRSHRLTSLPLYCTPLTVRRSRSRSHRGAAAGRQHAAQCARRRRCRTSPAARNPTGCAAARPRARRGARRRTAAGPSVAGRRPARLELGLPYRRFRVRVRGLGFHS